MVDTMGTLVFVGAGLSGSGSFSIDALDAVRSADRVFLETYTTLIDPSLPLELEKLTGKRVVPVGRAEVENGFSLLEAATSGRAVLIVGGEPMSATTHVSLRLEAAKKGIATDIVFAASVFTAAPSMLGLHQYKFGRTVSIPRFAENYRPVSPYRVAESNMSAGMHTLLLLDVDAEYSYFMSPNEAIAELLEMGKELGSTSIHGETVMCVVSRAGRRDSRSEAGSIHRLSTMEFGPPPHCLVLPGRLHFQEAQALMIFSGAREEELRSIIE